MIVIVYGLVLAVVELVRSRVAHADNARDPDGADTSRLHHEGDGDKSRQDLEIGVAEDRARRHREAVLGLLTLTVLADARLRHLIVLASQAPNGVRPAQMFQHPAPAVVVGIVLDQHGEVHVFE